MRNFLTYLGVFVVAVVLLQLFVLDSMQVSFYFAPLAYVAFVVLLPVNTRPIAVLLLGFVTGVFMDFFEGMGGLHTAAILLTAYSRRLVMILTLGRDTVEETVGMPSPKLLGKARFIRYAGVVVIIHCLAFFSLEALTWQNYHIVLMKTAVSVLFTLLFVWMVAMMFTARDGRRI